MTCAELYKLMDNPAMLSEQTLPDLKQIVTDFPYFHAARMLYLKNLEVINDLRLKVDLKKMAIYIPDRIKLFLLLESNRYAQQKIEKPAKETPKDSSFTLVNEFLSKTTGDDSQLTPTESIFEPVTSMDYVDWLKGTDADSPSEQKFQHQDLIDSFIEGGSERIGKKLDQDALPTPDSNDENSDSEEMPELDKEALDSSYFTETLAHVYIRQKRYDKALEIIKNLSLKYPEKNIYFADQIRFLEKLIIHSK